MISGNTFVFVVCGAAEHINTLNFSLRMLRHFSRNRICVVTDVKRNAAPIEHEDIIHVDTPTEYTHHQASIFLKTGLHRWLDMKQRYCYLDTDVIAVNYGVDEVFNHYRSPISFCTDHCRMRKFSPSAVADPVVDQFRNDRKQLDESIEKHRRLQQSKIANHSTYVEVDKEMKHWNDELARERWAGELIQVTDSILRKQAMNLLLIYLFAHYACKGVKWSSDFLYRLVYEFVNLVLYIPVKFLFQETESGDFYFRHSTVLIKRKWIFPAYFNDKGVYYSPLNKGFYSNERQLLFRYHSAEKAIQQETGFKWDEDKKQWKYRNGTVFYYDESDTLRDRIAEKFGVDVKEPNWQHWNGGVFLFDASSVSFLENWHQWTMEIFSDEKWKTRDQGTLIATAWKFGLHNHPTLPIDFNFIADYFHSTMVYHGNFEFNLDKRKHNLSPSFLHIYHHWGDRSWRLWQDVEALHDSILATEQPHLV